ncbi:MAG TPA: hypothetical protein VLL77_08160, partial [Anaerolineales bacterium]|nr:hypothetical protein [Anaerolineales bacterium]
MAGVDPIPKSDAETQGIDLDSFARLGDEEAVFLRILARVPGYAEAIWGAMSESLFEGNVDHRLKEIVRLQLASTAEDAYFGDLRS